MTPTWFDTSPWVAVPGAGIELLVNPGFDTDLAGWTLDGGLSPQWVSPGAMRCRKPAGQPPSSISRARQGVTVIPGGVYRLAWGWTIVINNGAIFIGTTSTGGELYAAAPAAGPGSVDVVAPGSAIFVQFRVGTGQGEIIVDDVSLKRIR